MLRPNKDQWAMKLAELTAKRSTCCRRQVGCILLNDRGHVLATGYNGIAAGLPHCNEVTGTKKGIEHWEDNRIFANACEGAHSSSGTNLDACQAIHAEQNALLQCSDVYQIHTCYVTASPCMTCTKLLLNTGCQRIVYGEEYPHNQAGELWRSAGLDWLKFGQL
jgi:dCMP deaminase